MTNSLSITLAQLNFTVGDLRGNAAKIIAATQKAAAEGADLVIFPEMAITGYPAEDLLFKEVFQQAAMQTARDIAAALKDCPAAALVGGYWVENGTRYNCAFLMEGGEIIHRHDKHWLPNYGVFDEKRLFTKGPEPAPYEWRGITLGILICEDLWKPGTPAALTKAGAELLLSLNASPFEIGKFERREEVVAAGYHGITEALGHDHFPPVLYVNMTGGQDELVFDGHSFVTNPDGSKPVIFPAFEESLQLTKWLRNDAGEWWCDTQQRAPIFSKDSFAIYGAMVVGLRDYVEKNGFNGVVIGISGGIDSGLTAAIAVDALGKDKVKGLIMPSPYTSAESIEDAEALIANLGIESHTISITNAMKTYDAMLHEAFKGAAPDATEENIQARIRGSLLMAYSNKHGYMVLTTGNKSEMSVGYATLYGDMCGGYSVLKDAYKTTVFELSRWRNRVSLQSLPKHILKGVEGAIIPERMITKPPSAELRPDQLDEDSLPPYPVLDGILHGLIEDRLSIQDLVARGYDAETVERVAKLIYIAEYKRRQSPPGVKLTGMSFGRDRRYPITNKWIWNR